MTELLTRPRIIPSWVAGLVQDAESRALGPGTIVEGENMIPLPAGRQATRGGSRIVRTLNDDAGSPAELTHVCILAPFTPVGALAIGWSDGRNRHYAYRLTADMAFFSGAEATSRHDLSAAPSTTWANALSPARPVLAELFEKMFVADATVDFANRSEFLSIDSSGTVVRPTFSFDGGAAAALQPYCLEEYNGVLFLAGYGDAGGEDRPELLRHSFLARSPDDTTAGAEGFNKDAYLLLGAEGQRVTALRKGRGLLLAAKANELYRISGFGRAYPGWQYTVENVHNTHGLGVSNPHALFYASGYWWGVGGQGPFRTDGFEVESLVGPRQRGWQSMNQIDSAWVTLHPERQLVLFGVHPSQASSGRSTTYPWVIWAWDLQRDVWAPDWKHGADFFMAAAVATATAAGPSAAPSAPDAASIATTSWTGEFTAGDATALTEHWIKEGSGGTWLLYATVAAGAVTSAVTGKKSHLEYFQKFRHRKNGLVSDFTSEDSVKTLISAPSLSGGCQGYDTVALISVSQSCEGTTTLVLESSPAGAGTWSELDTGPGPNNTFYQFVSEATDFRARCRDLSWPTTESDPSASEEIGPCDR